MEEKILEIFKLANELNNKQEKVYAKITYSANDDKILEIMVISKENYSYIERDSIMLSRHETAKLDAIIRIFTNLILDICNNEI